MGTIQQEKIVNYLKKYGFIFQGSEIYGGLANSWDYGPVGVLLKNNLKNLWWKEFCLKNKEAVGLDSSILLNPSVWKTSGHVANFSDPLIDCKECHQRFRADKLIEANLTGANVTEATSLQDLYKIIVENKIKCPNCGSVNWTEPRKFNLMFKTHQGVIEDDSALIYLRPETAQGIFINFLNIQRTTRMKLPFCVCQIGKAFRNEITPGNFIFRTREFEQMEIEYFCNPNDASRIFEEQLNKIQLFLTKNIGLENNNIKLVEHKKEELSHYSSRTVDIQYNFPHGFSELWGIANRTNYDLSIHSKETKKELVYLDQITNTKITPYVVEPSVGCDRLLYAIICDKYCVENVDNEEREILKLPYSLSPYKFAVLPLNNKLKDKADEIYSLIVEKGISTTTDLSSSSIGKKYRRQDAIGTYYCITIDPQTLDDDCVTIRTRDDMKQERIKIEDITKYFNN